MSGIYGMVSASRSTPDTSQFQAMQAVLTQDGSECISSYDSHIALGQAHHGQFNNLISNDDLKITLAFDGIIANYRELREDLIGMGHSFTTLHPAETIVHLYQEEGTKLLPRLRGPFAFALWDHQTQRLFLACDLMAQTPLYYHETEQGLIFASTIPALLTHPAVPRRSLLTDQTMLTFDLYAGRTPESMTAFKDIQILSAGEFLVRGADDKTSTKRQSWRVPPLEPANPKATLLDHEDRVCERLAESVRLYLTTDEPVGVFLSGGINSSLVAVMMQQQNRPLKTFTARFGPHETPETQRAAQVAAHIGAQHKLLTLPAPDLNRLLPRLVWHTGQPILSPHDILIALLSEAIQGEVRTALIGTGGTALFGDPLQDIRPKPRFRSVWNTASTFLQRARVIRQREEAREEARLDLFSPSAIEGLIGVRPDFTFSSLSPVSRASAVIASFLMQRLAPTHHVGEAYDLEVHAPFADAEVVSAAAQIPLNLKQKPGKPLYILYEAAYGLLPSALLNYPLPSEALPLAAWLREQEKTVRDLLLGKKALRRALFRRPMVERFITQHLQGKADHSYELLALMSFEIWHQLFIDPTVLAAPIESF